MSVTIDTSTNAQATSDSRQRKVDRNQDGTLWAVQSSTLSNAEFWYSKDRGASWTYAAGCDIDGATKVSLFIDADDNAHVVWIQIGAGGGRTQLCLYYAFGTPNAGRTSYTWSAAKRLTTTAMSSACTPDVVACRRAGGTSWDAFVVSGFTDGVNAEVLYGRLDISAAGVVADPVRDGLTDSGRLSSGGTMGLLSTRYAALAGDYAPTISFHHDGDGKLVSGGLEHVYVAWMLSAAPAWGIYFRRAAHDGVSTWTWAAQATLDAINDDGSPTGRCSVVSFYDGTRIVICGKVYNNHLGYYNLIQLEVNEPGTSVSGSTIVSNVNATSDFVDCTASYDPSGNIYFYYTDTTGLRRRKWERATQVLNAPTTVEPVANTPNNPSVSRDRGTGSSAYGHCVVFTTGSGSPYTVKSDFLSFSNAPNAPVLLTPGANNYADLAGGGLFDWAFSDQDAGDYQTAWRMRRKVGAGAYEYYNVSTGLWVPAVEQDNVSPLSEYTFPATKWTAGITYNWSVATRDASSLWGPYAADRQVTVSAAPVVVVTAPTGVYGTSSRPTVTWTFTDAEGSAQVTYRVKIFTEAQALLAGFNPATSVPVHDSGEIASAALRTHTITADLPNLTAYRAYVQASQTGSQYSAWAYASFTLAVDPPAIPLVTAVLDSVLFRVLLTIQGRDNIATVNQASAETSAADFGNNGNATVAQSNTVAFTGANSVRLTAIAAGAMSVFTPNPVGVTYPVVPGQVYTFLCHMRAATTGRSCVIDLSFIDAAGATIGAAERGPTVTTSASYWSQIRATSVAPPLAVGARAVIRVNDAGVALGEQHYIDGVSFFPDPYGNIINEPNFEVSVGQWIATGSATVARSSLVNTYAGVGSMEATSTNVVGSGGARSGTMRLYAGKTYLFAARVFNPTGSTVASISIGHSGTFGSATNDTSGAAAATTAVKGAWTLIYFTLTVNAADVNGAVTIQFPSGTAVGQKIYIGGVQVIQDWPVGTPPPAFTHYSVRNRLSNPSAETNLTNISAANGTSTLTRDTTVGKFGTSSAKMVTAGTAANEGLYYKSSSTSLTPGPLTGSVWVKGPAGATLSVWLRSYNGLVTGGVTDVEGAANTATMTGDWQRITAPAITSTIAGEVILMARTPTGANQAITFWTDGAMLTYGTLYEDYVDGSLGPNYAWEGTAHGGLSRKEPLVYTRGGLAGTVKASVERSDDAGMTWRAVRGGTDLLLPATTQQVSLYDYEAPPNKTALYRAKATVDV